MKRIKAPVMKTILQVSYSNAMAARRSAEDKRSGLPRFGTILFSRKSASLNFRTPFRAKTPSFLNRILLLFILFLAVAIPVFAENPDWLERVEIPSSLNPVGSGARVLGMGGAFIAVADDATSASWNPGGLIQLENPELSVVAGGFHRIEDNAFAAYPGANGEQTVEKTALNYFSAAYPFSLNEHNMIVSVNYQHLYDFTRQWNFPLNINYANTSAIQNVDYRQEGALSAIGLAFCAQVTPRISAGCTLNVWDDDLTENEWEQKMFQWGSGTSNGLNMEFWASGYDRYTFSGVNTNLGLLWDVNGKLTLGAVLKTPFRAHIMHDHREQTAIHYPDTPIFDKTEPPEEFSEHAHLNMPMSYGIGAAWRFSHAFTMSLDIYRTEWDDFEYEDAQGRKTSPISGKAMDDSDINPTHQVRMGAEYLFIKQKFVIPFRAGVFYDPAPADGSPDDFWGFSLGSGIAYGRYIFDMAWQLRRGENVGGAGMEMYGLSQDVEEHTVYASLIVHF